MKETVELFTIVPPSEDHLDDFGLFQSLADTPDRSWSRFTHPSLKQKGYENDGFIAKKVKVTIEVIE